MPLAGVWVAYTLGGRQRILTQSTQVASLIKFDEGVVQFRENTLLALSCADTLLSVCQGCATKFCAMVCTRWTVSVAAPKI